MTDIYHKAARDGYLDLLRGATRKDADCQDEDGMTPTSWAAYHGNLEALRMIVGRGGNPDKCDYFGSTALHHAAANGHMNCVSFLVSFGANLWALDNEFHTALDVSAINEHEHIVRYLDAVLAKQAALNKKVVKKLKERAILEAQKRQKKLDKLQKDASKNAQKREKDLTKEKSKMLVGSVRSAPSKLFPTGSISSRSSSKNTLTSRKSNFSEPKPYSAHFSVSKENGANKSLTGVAKRIERITRQSKKQNNSDNSEANGDFKIGEIEDGKRTVRSLSGYQRDNQVLYVNKHEDLKDARKNGRINGTLSNKDKSDTVSRAISEPDFLYNGNSMENGIFERPGFGSVSFINKRTTTGLYSIPLNNDEDEAFIQNGDDTISLPAMRNNTGRISRKTSFTDSIGTVGSLAVRMRDLPWEDEDVETLDDEEFESSNLELFLSSNELIEFFPLFAREKVDLKALMLLTDSDLKDLGLQLGPRRKMLDACAKRKQVISSPGAMMDSLL